MHVPSRLLACRAAARDCGSSKDRDDPVPMDITDVAALERSGSFAPGPEGNGASSEGSEGSEESEIKVSDKAAARSRSIPYFIVLF